MMNSSQSTKTRYRASIACAGCRIRRTRCIIGRGQASCDRCIRLDTTCVIREDDDQRKQPLTKAKVNSLVKHIKVLEQMLDDANIEVPDKPDAAELQCRDSAGALHTQDAPSRLRPLPGRAGHEESTSRDGLTSASIVVGPEPVSLSPATTTASASAIASSPSESTAMHPAAQKKLGAGLFSYDQLGRSRYYGATANYHIISDAYRQVMRGNQEAINTSARRFLDTIPATLADYLLDRFWSCYNLHIHIVHRTAFEADRAAGADQCYSGFLHICMLAIGFRYANKSRDGMQSFVGANGESRFHAEAKRLVDHELKMPGGVPSLQALLLLGDLESGVGKYNTGWLYSGMASRLIFDLGLNRDGHEGSTAAPDASLDLGTQVRRVALWGCIMLDRFWGLFLGRPTSIKLSDVSINYDPNRCLQGCYPAGPAHTLDTEIYQSLVSLLAIAERLLTAHHRSPSEPSAYYYAAGVERELRNWYDGLPNHLRWDIADVDNMPASFFNLHQQYHHILILLYRPFSSEIASSEPGQPNSKPSNSHGWATQHSDMVTTLARQTCFHHAFDVARIIDAFRRRFDISTMFVTGMQHATTAAIAIVDGLSGETSPATHSEALSHLQCLAETLQAHASVYFPAHIMSEILRGVINDYLAATQQSRQQVAAGSDPQGAAQHCQQQQRRQDVDGTGSQLAISHSTLGQQGHGVDAACWPVQSMESGAEAFHPPPPDLGMAGLAPDPELDLIWESILDTLSQSTGTDGFGQIGPLG